MQLIFSAVVRCNFQLLQRIEFTIPWSGARKDVGDTDNDEGCEERDAEQC